MILKFLEFVFGKALSPITDTVVDIVKSYSNRKITEAELRAEVEKKIAESLTRITEKELEESGEIILGEIRGESWLQRNWRPLVALMAFFSYWFVIVAYPFFVAWGILPQVRFGEEGLQNLFQLTIVSVGGYMGFRTIEKVTRIIKR